MRRKCFTQYATLVVLWGYLSSVVLAKQFWGTVFDRLIGALDLSSSQSWSLPFAANLIIAAVAAPVVVKYLLGLRERAAYSPCHHAVLSLCLVGCCLCLRSALGLVFLRPKEFATAVGEIVGSKRKSVFEAGKLTDGSYSNSVLGLALKFPHDWHPLSLNAIDRSKHSGAQNVFGQDPEKARTGAAAREGFYPLLAIRKYAEPHTGYNPSLVLNAYEKQSIAAMGSRDIETYARSFLSLGGPYQVRSGPTKLVLGAFDGYYVQLEARLPKFTIQQHLYITETEHLYVELVASVIDESDFTTLKAAVATLVLQK
jgi:hypothetical protein